MEARRKCLIINDLHKHPYVTLYLLGTYTRGLPNPTPPFSRQFLSYTDVKNLIYFYPQRDKNPPYYAQNRKNKPQGGLS